MLLKVLVFDFVTHTSESKRVHLSLRLILVLEGMLIVDGQKMGVLLDLAAFVEVDKETRLVRRLERDT